MTLLFALAIAAGAGVGCAYAFTIWREEGDKTAAILVGVPCLLFLAAAVQAFIVRL